MVMCWPTLALFVACCPKPETLAPEQVECPVHIEDAERCCTPYVFKKLFAQLGNLSQWELRQIMPQDSYQDIVSTVIYQLFGYVRDIGLLHVDAWRLHAIASTRHAIAQADGIKDVAVQRVTADGMRELWRSALVGSRLLARALFRVENFQQFLLGHTAHSQDQMLQGFNPEEVRATFEPVMDVYKEGVRAHDLLVYSIIPQTERFFSAERVVLSHPVINLLVVSLGAWAKTGFITVWSALKRASCRLRFFVLGDGAGLEAWRAAVAELEAEPAAKVLLGHAIFEYVDFATHPRFQAFLRRYPKGCAFGDGHAAILARVVCHEVVPLDVDRVISMDLGDVLVLDDLKGLWDLGDQLQEHQVMAAAHAVSLHHVNGGLVLYDTRRMRERNFSSSALRAARDGLKRDAASAQAKGGWDGACLRDQSIINILHSLREEYGYSGPSPVMILPCRWSLFPATEWQPHWNSPEEWLPEVVERRRYPGVVSMDRVEVYCPDEADMLSAWAWIPMTEHSDGKSRQSRIRLYAYHEGRKRTRYCSPARSLGDKCCRCGEAAAIVHVAGDLKSWPAMGNLLRAHMPPWKEPPPEDALLRASSRTWWGGDARASRMLRHTEAEAYFVAKSLGLNAQFPRCVTMRTEHGLGPGRVSYHKLELSSPSTSGWRPRRRGTRTCSSASGATPAWSWSWARSRGRPRTCG